MFRIRETFKDYEELKAFYRGLDNPPPPHEPITEMSKRGEAEEYRHQWVLANLKETNAKSVLEVGAANGNFLWVLMENGYNVGGLEPVPNPYKMASKNVGGTNIRVFNDFVEEHKADMKYDAVVCLEAIEHAFDVDKFGAAIRGFIKKGGYFLGSTPAEAGSYGSRNFNDQHLYSATPESMREFLIKHKFEPEQVTEGDDLIMWRAKAV